MVVTKIIGGLGNQLFQYAAARNIAIKNQTDLYLDVKKLSSDYNTRLFKLGHFNTNFKNADHRILKNFIKLENPFERVLRKLKSFFISSETVYEKSLRFDPLVLQKKGIIYLDGYWQSEKYFLSIRPILLQELEVKTPPSNENRVFLEKINSLSNTVSLHIRRGDYVSDPRAREIHGLCSLDYYFQAMVWMENQFGKCTFVVFSDDLDWAKQNLKTDAALLFADINDSETDYEDLRLMYSCEHHITANSSFSWWGAWLNPLENKKVIAPKKWFNDSEKDCSDLIPDSWIKL